MSEWEYDNSINPDDYFGFIYKITNLDDGRIYIGQKQIHTYKGKGKKQTKKEGPWRKYWSSCKELKEDVKRLGEDKFKREILHWCPEKAGMLYAEVFEQCRHNVLGITLTDGRRASYNANIMGKFYKSPDWFKP
jgi:hypothetical protein